MKIYVASAYGRRNKNLLKTREENVWHSIEIGRQLILKGHTPFLPLLYHYVCANWLKAPAEPIWHDMCLAWLYNCQAIFRDNSKSWGADDEVQKGRLAGLTIYHSMEEVPNAV